MIKFWKCGSSLETSPFSASSTAPREEGKNDAWRPFSLSFSNYFRIPLCGRLEFDEQVGWAFLSSLGLWAWWMAFGPFFLMLRLPWITSIVGLWTPGGSLRCWIWSMVDWKNRPLQIYFSNLSSLFYSMICQIVLCIFFLWYWISIILLKLYDFSGGNHKLSNIACILSCLKCKSAN